MGDTTPNGLRYPLPTDAPQIDQDIKKLAQDVDSKAVFKTGGTMTGALTLSGDPTSSGHAARKGYVDAMALPTYIATATPTDRTWNTGSTTTAKTYNTATLTAGANPCWAYDYQNPYASRKYVVQATLDSAISVQENVTLTLKIMHYGSASSVYAYNSIYLVRPPQGAYVPASITVSAAIPSNSGFSVRFELTASFTGAVTAPFYPRGSIDQQRLSVLVQPGVTLGSVWP